MATAEATSGEREVTLTLTETEAAAIMAIAGKGHVADPLDSVYKALSRIRPRLGPTFRVDFDGEAFGPKFRIKES